MCKLRRICAFPTLKILKKKKQRSEKKKLFSKCPVMIKYVIYLRKMKKKVFFWYMYIYNK